MTRCWCFGQPGAAGHVPPRESIAWATAGGVPQSSEQCQFHLVCLVGHLSAGRPTDAGVDLCSSEVMAADQVVVLKDALSVTNTVC